MLLRSSFSDLTQMGDQKGT